MESESDHESKNTAEPVKKDTQAPTERYYPPPLPSSIEVQFSRRIEEGYNATQRKQDSREKLKIILEALTVIFVFVSVVVSWYMWSEMRKATEAATLSADAAAASTSAWIVVVGMSFKGIADNYIHSQIVLKNVGHTPALNARIGWKYSFIRSGNMNDFPKYNSFECHEDTVKFGILPPNIDWVNDGKTILTEDQAKMIREGTGMMFIHGCAKYRDLLSEKERITEMAGFFPASGESWDKPGGLVIYEPYSRMK